MSSKEITRPLVLFSVICLPVSLYWHILPRTGDNVAVVDYIHPREQ